MTPNAPAANYILQIAGFNGEGEATSLAMAVSISGQTTSDALMATWTKKIGSSSAKIYAKNIVGAGKVQFFLNGKEIAWVNAVSASDSKLRSANGANYMVRTAKLVEGRKNVIEIYVEGIRIRRDAYSN